MVKSFHYDRLRPRYRNPGVETVNGVLFSVKNRGLCVRNEGEERFEVTFERSMPCSE